MRRERLKALRFLTPTSLSYAQIAAVVNYVRSNFGNNFRDTITPEEVAALDQRKP